MTVGRSIQPTGAFTATVRAGEVVSITASGVVLAIRTVKLPSRGRLGILRVLAQVDGITRRRTIAVVPNGATPRRVLFGQVRVGAMVSEDGGSARVGAEWSDPRGSLEDACDVDADCVLTVEALCERLCTPRPLHRDALDRMHQTQRFITCPGEPRPVCPPSRPLTGARCQANRCRAY